MRVCCFVLVLGFGSWTTVPVVAQSGVVTLTGTVVDTTTGLPLAGVHVFIASSMIGTATDNAGHFHLDHVPEGAHRLYVSMLGYEPVATDTLLQGNRSYTFDFWLHPTILEMGEVVVSAKEAKRWRKQLDRFTKLFLGETNNAEYAAIKNPEVLNFEGKWGRLVATADAPLIIENEALGYRIQYFLKEFIQSGATIKYDGEPLYEAMTPVSSEEANRWYDNRRHAYYGSFRHYMLTLLNGQPEEEGFYTYRRFSLDKPSSLDKFWINPASFLEEGPTSTEKVLQFYGYLEIVYAEELEEEGYRYWLGRGGWSPPNNQKSWIKLTDGPTVIDHTGEIVDPYGVTVYGYFAYERVADQLPKEYRPEE